MDVRLCLVRHGQSLWQLGPREDLDTPLSDTGHRQAEELARWARGAWPGAPPLLFTSPLRRARETCAYLERGFGCGAVICDDLREAPFRVADQLPVRPAPFTVAAGAATPGYLAFRTQAGRALRHLADAARGEERPVLAVTHGGLIKTLLRVAAESDHICFEVSNAATTILDWADGRWRITRLSQEDHLPAALRTA